MTKKNRTLITLAVIVVIGGVVAFASNTEIFQGLMRSKQSPQQTEKQDKWWCTKNPVEEEGSGSVIVPEGGNGSGDSGGNGETQNNQEENQSTQTKGNKNGIVFVDPETIKLLKENKAKTLQKIYSDQNTINKTPGIPDSGNNTTPKPPNPPDKNKIEIECSCDASYTFVEEIGEKLQCGNPGSENTYEYEKDGEHYTITITKPEPGICQKDLKENEEEEVYLICTCDQDRIYSSKIDKTYDCPPPNNSYGTSVQPIKEGNFTVYIGKSSDLYCDQRWKCPEGYYEDAAFLDKECTKLKEALCKNKKIGQKYKFKEICNAVYKSIMGGSC